MDSRNLHKLETRYPKGRVVSGCVRRLLHYGAEVALEDGAKGIIRNRELRWGEEPKHPSEVLAKRQAVKALVLKVDQKRGRVELSLRQAEKDPWKDIAQRYRVGQVVRRKVVRLWRSGAFIELEPGIDGFVPINEVCTPRPEHIDHVLWVGDTVEGIITKLDHQEREIELSIRKHVRRLEREREKIRQREYLARTSKEGFMIGEAIGEEEREILIRLLQKRHLETKEDAEENQHAGVILAERLHRILLADDDKSFNASLQRLLSRFGYQVEAVESGERAVALSQECEFDLVLMDLGFPSSQMDGLEAARRILAIRPSPPVVIITGINWLERHITALEEAKQIGAKSVLLKPIDWGRLQRVMRYIAEGKGAWEVAQMPERVGGRLEFFSGLPELVSTREELIHVVHKHLKELQRTTGATACVLFHMTPATREVRVFAHTGAPLSDYEALKYTLQATPVDEVIRHGRQLFEPDVSRNPQKFRHLKLLEFSSCIGVPVQSLGKPQYGLFLFHPRRSHFTHAHLQQVQVSAGLLGVAIAWKDVGRLIRQVQPFIFLGQLGSGLVHEINNRLGSVINDANILAADREMLEEEPAMILEPKVRDRIGTCVSNIRDLGRSMEGLTQLYLSLIRKEEEAPINVNEMIYQAMRFLKPFAEDKDVRMVTDLEKDMPSTMMVGVRLEQIFMNVMLNAIQQMSLAKGRGELLIRTSFEPQDSSLPIKARFADTGPGVHGQHLDRIFELGFSTRPDGTGLGLFIAKGLVESLGGKISVEESVMLLGTTFLVELPLVVPSVEGVRK